MLRKNKTKKKNTSKSKRSSLIAKAGGRIGGKLPKSKVKLTYLAILGVFLLTIVGYAGKTAYDYYSYKQFVAHAQFTWPVSDNGVNFKACKGRTITDRNYGTLVEFVMVTERWSSYTQYLEFKVYRPYVPWGSNYGLESGLTKVSNQFWAGIGNRTTIWLSYNWRDKVSVQGKFSTSGYIRPNDGTATTTTGEHFFDFSIPFCDPGA